MKKESNENSGIDASIRNPLYPNKVEIFMEQS